MVSIVLKSSSKNYYLLFCEYMMMFSYVSFSLETNANNSNSTLKAPRMGTA